jgi:hypothetical protein
MTSPLLSLLGACPGPPDAVRAALQGVDGTKLVKEAARHGLSGLVRHELQLAGVSLDEEATERLRGDTFSIAATGLRVKQLLFQALSALRSRGIVPVLLKGYGLAKRLYPAPLYRPMTDVDLLVSRAQLASAEAALIEIGLRKYTPFEKYHLAHQHHLDFYGPAGSLELHFRAISGFGSAIEGDELIDQSLGDSLDDHDVRYLRPEDELPYLATHATQHLFKNVAWLFDLKLFALGHPNLEWGEVLATACRSGMEGPAYFALHTARTALGAKIPEWIVDALRPSQWQAAIGEFIFAKKRLVTAPFADLHYSWLVSPLLSSDWANISKAGLLLAWRAPLRKIHRHFPSVTPASWRA